MPGECALENVHCGWSCWPKDHTLSSKKLNGRSLPSWPMKSSYRNHVLLDLLWVVAYKWGFSPSGPKPEGNSVGSSQWPQDVIMSLREFSLKGSSLGVKLHPLNQEMESGSCLISVTSGTSTGRTSSLGPGHMSGLSYPPSSTPHILSVIGESRGH